ncbi:MAG: AAA family ATPase [Acidimicrobiia bacterium]
MGQLKIQLLGGFLLEWDGRPIPPIASKAGRSLFAYLVTYRDRAPTRDLLAGLFWPDQPEPRARRRLSQALWQIQSVLSQVPAEEPFLLVTPSTISFNSDASYVLDVEELEQGLVGSADESPDQRYQQLEAAVSLYRGDFLAGFYDDWVLSEQRRIRDEYLTGVEELLQLAKSRAQFEEALGFAHRLALHDPLREDSHQEVMRLAYLIGRSTEAIQQYERLRSILTEELGVEPSESTEQLYREIVSRTERGTRPFAPAPDSPLFDQSGVPFVGRDTERSQVLARMEEVMAGRGGLVLLEGESGVGKSRLLTQLADDAHWRGLGVLWGQCTATSAPFDPILVALQHELSPLRVRQLAQRVETVWLREASELLPQISETLQDLPERIPLLAGEEPARTREAIARILLGLGEVNPYLVVIDDLHWSDLDSLRLIESLSDRLHASGIVLCLSFRSDDARQRAPVWDVLRSVDATGAAHRIVLTPLSEVETIELVRRSLGVPTVADEASRLLYKDTGGNPLFTLETLRALHDLETTDSVAYLAGQGPLPVREELPIANTVQELVAGRLDALPASVAAVLDTAAVFGDRPALEVLAATPGLRTVDLLSAVDVMIRRGLLREVEGHLEFSHGQVRRVAYERVSAAEARKLHREIGDALERTDSGTAGERAHHFENGQAWDQAVSYHRLAGQEAVSVHAYETAAEHYGSASALDQTAQVLESERFELLAEFDDVLDVLGHRRQQASVLEELAEFPVEGPTYLIDLRLRQARASGATGDLDTAVDLAQVALDASQANGLVPEEARSLIAVGTYLVWAGRAAEAISPLEEAVASSGDDRARRSEARHRLGSAFAEVQRYEDAKRVLRVALEDAKAGGDLRARAGVLGTLAIASAETGDPEGAEATYGETLALCRRIGYRRGEGVNLVNLANVLYFRGQIGDALGHYDEASEIFRQLGERRGEATVLANSASVRASVLGDSERAAADADRARAYFKDSGDLRGEAQCLGILATAERVEGHLAEAHALANEGMEEAAQSGNQWMSVQLQGTKARLLLDAEDPAEALELARKAVATCEQLGMSDLEVSLRAMTAEALLALGRMTEARQAADRAVQGLHPGVERPHLVWFAASRVLEALGEELPAREALSRAVEELETSLNGLDPTDQDRARAAVPEHRLIVEAWERVQPHHIRQQVVGLDTPTGRRLEAEDMVEIDWTMPAPPAGGWRSEPAGRRELLMSLIEQARAQGGSPTVNDLAHALGVSTATVRRDLGILREEGKKPITRGSRG